jgi:hypothetical protein
VMSDSCGDTYQHSCVSILFTNICTRQAPPHFNK